MKEQKFEKIVQWREIGNFFLGLVLILIFSLAMLCDTPYPKLAGFTSGIIICLGISLCVYSFLDRKVYWRKIK